MVLATSVQKEDSSTPKSLDYCQSLANSLSKVDDLPAACLQYAPVVQKLKDKQKAATDPFAGMGPSATQARSARAKGQESHHQIQRRLTTMGTRRFSKLDK